MAVASALPVRNADGIVAQPSRAGSYLEAITFPLGAGNLMFGVEGTFYQGCNATVGTGIAGHAAPVVADTDTKALLHLFNSGTTKNIIPVYLKLAFSAIGAGGTLSYNVIYTDKAGVTAKTSGGTVITPVNVHSHGSDTTGAVLTFGAVVTAMTASKKVFAGQCREVIPVVNDTMEIFFGSSNASINNALTAASTATNNLVQHAPPIVIGPGGNLNISRIRASQSGADSYTFSFGYIER
jgi:hypothetical protein